MGKGRAGAVVTRGGSPEQGKSVNASDAAVENVDGLLVYRTLVVDPPWSYANGSGRQSPDYASRMMSAEAIRVFGVNRWAHPAAAHLYLWATDIYVGDANVIARSWGFEPKTWLVWTKDRIGMGNYYRHQHELCLFAVRGRLKLSRRNASTVFRAPVTRHSEKPDAFYSLVESCSPGPYADIFGRRLRAGWDVFGDQVKTSYQFRLYGDSRSAVL